MRDTSEFLDVGDVHVRTGLDVVFVGFFSGFHSGFHPGLLAKVKVRVSMGLCNPDSSCVCQLHHVLDKKWVDQCATVWVVM